MRADERVRLILYVALFATDILAVFLGFLVANYLRHGTNLSSADLTATLALLPVFGGIAINSNAYGIKALRGVPHGLSRVILSLLFTSATLLFVAFYIKASMPLSRAIFGMVVVLRLVSPTAARFLFLRLVLRNFRDGLI